MIHMKMLGVGPICNVKNHPLPQKIKTQYGCHTKLFKVAIAQKRFVCQICDYAVYWTLLCWHIGLSLSTKFKMVTVNCSALVEVCSLLVFLVDYKTLFCRQASVEPLSWTEKEKVAAHSHRHTSWKNNAETNKTAATNITFYYWNK